MSNKASTSVNTPLMAMRTIIRPLWARLEAMVGTDNRIELVATKGIRRFRVIGLRAPRYQMAVESGSRVNPSCPERWEQISCFDHQVRRLFRQGVSSTSPDLARSLLFGIGPANACPDLDRPCLPPPSKVRCKDSICSNYYCASATPYIQKPTIRISCWANRPR